MVGKHEDRMVELTCPHCNHALRIPAQYGGQTGKCTHCGGALRVPQEESQPAGRNRGRFLALMGVGCVALSIGAFVILNRPSKEPDASQALNDGRLSQGTAPESSPKQETEPGFRRDRMATPILPAEATPGPQPKEDEIVFTNTGYFCYTLAEMTIRRELGEVTMSTSTPHQEYDGKVHILPAESRILLQQTPSFPQTVVCDLTTGYVSPAAVRDSNAFKLQVEYNEGPEGVITGARARLCGQVTFGQLTCLSVLVEMPNADEPFFVTFGYRGKPPS